MKAIAKTKAELGVEIIDAPVPRPGPNEILVRFQSRAWKAIARG